MKLTSLTIPCNFDLKLFGWNDSDGFTEESGVVPITGYSADFKPTNETTCKYICLTDLNKEPELKDVGITLSHGWDAGIVTRDPACTKKGEKKFTCNHNVEHTTTEEIPALGHDLSDVVISEPTAEKLGEVHSTCSRCDYDIFAHYTLKDGASPTMYPDGTRISDASYTPKAGGPFNLNGQEIEILLQDPLGVLVK